MITDTNIINTSVNKYPLLTRVVFFLSVFLLCISPIIIHAETITYDVCGSGCEYSSIYDVKDNINSLGDLSDKDIIINFNSNYDSDLYLASKDNIIKSITVNGNNHYISQLNVFAKKIVMNNIELKDAGIFKNAEEIIINNSPMAKVMIISLLFGEYIQIPNEEIDLKDLLEIDEISLSGIKAFAFVGNFKIENMDFKNKIVENIGSTINFYNCSFGTIISVTEYADASINIYNSTFSMLKYKSINSIEEYREFNNMTVDNIDTLGYDIYDVNLKELGLNTNTTVYFDRELEIKSTETKYLNNYLDYYTEDKEIDYVIEDESIAKIEGLALTGLKEGQTNITITTDDGHVVYRIKLNVIKEIEIPPSGINIKTSALIIGVVLLGIVGVGLYTLIKDKKKK